MTARVIVGGALAAKPGNGGEAWVRMNWVLGLAELGHDVTFVEQLPATACTRDAHRWFGEVTRSFGLCGRTLLLCEHPEHAGDAAEVAATLGKADVIVNLSGNLRSPRLLDRARVRVYVDLDPGFTQGWDIDELLDGALDRHDLLFTVGTNIGHPGCHVPVGDRTWHRLAPPVRLASWPRRPVVDEDLHTTITTWRAGHGVPDGHGTVPLTLKHHEFRRLRQLPRRARGRFLLAARAHRADTPDLEALRANNWVVHDAAIVTATPARYRRFVVRSGLECSAAHGVYVTLRTGWVSDRTACYLATGRPALVQDTGAQLPVGKGLVTFGTLDEAAVRSQEIREDYRAHSDAARELAEEHFDSRIICAAALERAMAIR
jgi:hypothetical protein